VVVDEDDEEEEDDEDELEDEVEVVLEEVVDVVDVVEEALDEETLVEVVEELGVVVDSVEDGVWLDETVCDWVLVFFDEPELRTRYPPTATTSTTTTITPTIVVLSALRLPRANEGKRPDMWVPQLIFLKGLAIRGLIRLSPADSPKAAPGKKSHSGTAHVSRATRPPAAPHGNA
jgi:hypothetical protein